MDSLAQAAGRCNREGKQSALAEVHVFVPDTSSPPGLITKGKSIVEEFVRTLPSEAFESPAIFATYFDSLYNRANDKGEQILRDMGGGFSDGSFPFRTIADKFRLIDDDTVPILVDYGDGAAVIDHIRHNGLDWLTLRKAQRSMVSVLKPLAEKLESIGHIEAITDGLYALTSLGRYDGNTGLDIWTDETAPNSLIL